MWDWSLRRRIRNAAGEEKGIYEPGYVIVTRTAKQAALQASANLRKASADAERQAAWAEFAKVADPLLAAKE